MINHSTVRVSGLSVALAAIAALAVPAPLVTAQQSGAPVSSFYDLKTSYLDGKPADLGAFRGKVTLAVNVASKCGFTPQYEGLEKLNRELAPKGFAVLGFPSNDFGAQEPGSPQEIAQFCKLTYDVTFPMFSKLVTKAGEGSVARLPVPRERRATCRRGTSASTSSARTARSSRSFRAR